MESLIVILVVALLLGPCRRLVLYPVLGAWKTVIPSILGWVLGRMIIEQYMPGSPGWIWIGGPLFTAFIIGPLGRELIEGFLGGEKKNGGQSTT